MIDFDSGEYEYLTEAVELSKSVSGMCVEIGLRLGFGTKTIIDACIEHRPGSTVLSIDPFGSLLYEHREGQFCRLDYTDGMYQQVLADMSEYVLGKPVCWIPFKQTDTRFFSQNSDGVELYDIETYVVNKYATVHLDGPHGGAALKNEITWFACRMDSGATIVIDDISEDFLHFEPVHDYLLYLGFEQNKIGLKKAIYQKL